MTEAPEPSKTKISLPRSPGSLRRCVPWQRGSLWNGPSAALRWEPPVGWSTLSLVKAIVHLLAYCCYWLDGIHFVILGMSLRRTRGLQLLGSQFHFTFQHNIWIRSKLVWVTSEKAGSWHNYSFLADIFLSSSLHIAASAPFILAQEGWGAGKQGTWDLVALILTNSALGHTLPLNGPPYQGYMLRAVCAFSINCR